MSAAQRLGGLGFPIWLQCPGSRSVSWLNYKGLRERGRDCDGDAANRGVLCGRPADVWPRRHALRIPRGVAGEPERAGCAFPSQRPPTADRVASSCQMTLLCATSACRYSDHVCFAVGRAAFRHLSDSAPGRCGGTKEVQWDRADRPPEIANGPPLPCRQGHAASAVARPVRTPDSFRVSLAPFTVRPCGMERRSQRARSLTPIAPTSRLGYWTQ